ncbi:MAG: S8 family serine peptidase [Gammaproteobacteria bacterium]|nr:S8 family serine peptidase [Gammaproteobacteria bacterium]
MNKKLKISAAALIGVGLSLPTSLLAESYIVMTKGNKISPQLIQSIEQQGATVTAQVPQIGMITIESDHSDIRERLNGFQQIESTFADFTLSYVEPEQAAEFDISFEEMAVSPPFTGDDDFLFDLQWGHTAVNATAAWEAGVKGQGVRVAVLDSGIRSDHPDLVPNLNTSLSTSFVAGEDYDNPPGSHGTHVAGTIAAADNGIGVIGVAPEAEIVAVKVLSAVTGSGSTSGIWQGMVYAADNGADIINMSLGISGGLPKNCTFDNGDGTSTHYPAKDCSEFVRTYNRVTDYVRKQGTLIVSSAGNDGRDMNHDASTTALPAEANHVISVSATAPYLWGVNPYVNLDELASYSNYGQKGIDLAAPGGDYDVIFDYGFATCTGYVVTGRPCYVYDMVLSTTATGWGWNAGTSMASPHVAGVAALIISEHNGDISVEQLERELKARAEGGGNSAELGHGRVSSGHE